MALLFDKNIKKQPPSEDEGCLKCRDKSRESEL